MDEREKMRSWIDKLVQLLREKGAVGIKQDMDLLLTGALRLGAELAKAAQASAAQGTPTAKPAKRAPKKAPQRRPRPPSNTGSAKPKQATQARSVERSDSHAPLSAALMNAPNITFSGVFEFSLRARQEATLHLTVS